MWDKRDGVDYVPVYARHLHYLANTRMPVLYRDCYCAIRTKAQREEWVQQRLQAAQDPAQEAEDFVPPVNPNRHGPNSQAEEYSDEEIDPGDLSDGDGCEDDEDSGNYIYACISGC